MKPRARRLQASILFLVLTVLAFAGVDRADRAPVSAAGATKPNIILILTDDQDQLLNSLNYMPRVRTLLADRGTTFSRSFVPLSLCCPSRTTILTGRYTHNTQVYTNAMPDGGFRVFQALGHENFTVGVALQAAGYRTGLMGKYLNAYPSGEADTYVPPGWDEWAVPADGQAYFQFNYVLNLNGVLIPHGKAEADYLDDVITKQARAFITDAVDNRAPFFLYFAPYAPHKPATPAPRHSKLFAGIKAPRTPSFDEANVKDKPAAISSRPRLSKAQIAELDRLYRLRLQSLQAVDEAVAGLVALLQEKGQLDNTYILFTSDNGFHMGQHRLLATKYTPYEEDIRVPLIVRGPGVPAGKTVSAFVQNVDLAPTIAQLAGATMPVKVDGRSFVPYLTGAAPANWRQQVFLEQFKFREVAPASGVFEPLDNKDLEEYPSHLGLRTATYKYVEYSTGEREYYDLVKDPYELQNRANELTGTLLGQLSARVHAFATCEGRDCRNLEIQPPIKGLK